MFLNCFIFSRKLKSNTSISGQSRGSSLQSVLGVGWYCSLFVSWIMELWSWLIAQSAVIPTPTRTNSKLSNFKTKAGEFVKLLKIPAAAAEESSGAESGMWFLIPLPLLAPGIKRIRSYQHRQQLRLFWSRFQVPIINIPLWPCWKFINWVY